MPSNKFPDSSEKRELRRQDARRLESFKLQNNLATGLSYCGMPSIEFLDIKAWRNHLHSVCALEFDSDNLADMRIEWDNLSLSLPVKFINADVLDYLLTTDKVFDIYNLDFYGGFVNRNKSGNPRCVEAIKYLIDRQAKKQTSFVLITTNLCAGGFAPRHLKRSAFRIRKQKGFSFRASAVILKLLAVESCRASRIESCVLKFNNCVGKRMRRELRGKPKLVGLETSRALRIESCAENLTSLWRESAWRRKFLG